MKRSYSSIVRMRLADALLTRILNQTIRNDEVVENLTFLDAGGDSLGAIEFIGRVRDELSCSVSIEDVVRKSILEIRVQVVAEYRLRWPQVARDMALVVFSAKRSR
jgi:acyl carrier protein